jgi:hypothetical protein
LLGLGLLTVLLLWISAGNITDESSDAGDLRSGPEAIPTPPVLVFDMTEAERQAVTEFRLDGKPQNLPPQSTYVLRAGEHTVLLRREGYEDIQVTKQLVDQQEWVFRPRWRRRSAPKTSGSAERSGLEFPRPTEPTTPALDGATPDNLDMAPMAPPGLSPESDSADTAPKPLGARGGGFDSSAVSGFSTGFGSQVAYWPFDASLEDASGNGRDLELNDVSEYVDGKTGRALRFSPGLKLVGNESFFAPSSELSVAFWLRLERASAEDVPLLDGGGFQLFLQGGYPRLQVNASAPAAGPNTEEATHGFRPIDLAQHFDRWVHLAMVYSGPMRQVHYYLDGKHEGFQRFTDAGPVEMTQLVVGNLNGDLDELRVMDYRLSSVDVAALLAGSFVPYAASPEFPDGRASCATWYGVPEGLLRRQLEGVFLQPPDATIELTTQLAHLAPGGEGSRLDRIRGFLFPPEGGDYTFLLYGSGDAMLYLQRTSPEENTLAEVVVNKKGKSVESPPLRLNKAEGYYFEILHRYEAPSGGALRLNWQGPATPDGSSVTIPLEYVARYE